MRLSFMLTALCAIAVPGAALSATGDTEQAVVADCGQPGLAGSAVDTCLERARILDETNPSPQIETLIARLEAEATGRPESSPPGASAAGQEPAEDQSRRSSQASSSPRRLGSGPPEAEAPPPRQGEGLIPPNQDIEDNDVPPIDDAASPASSAPDEGASPGEDNDDDDDAPPIDDAPNG